MIPLGRFSNIFNININPETGVFAAIGVIIAPVIEYLYGDGSGKVITLLFLVIAMDWITGIVAANKDGVYTSEYGIEGVFRSIVILLIPAAANYIDQIFDTPGSIFYGTAFALIYHNWKSMTANAVRAKWDKWIPATVINRVLSEVEAKASRAKKRKRELEKNKENEKY